MLSTREKKWREKRQTNKYRKQQNWQKLTIEYQVCLLREVKYFLMLKIEVPESAMQIFQKNETYYTTLNPEPQNRNPKS